MLQAATLLMLLLSQSVGHVEATKSPADLIAEGLAQLPTIAQVDLTGEVQKALRAASTPTPSSPLRAH
jgi:hypothetical protein